MAKKKSSARSPDGPEPYRGRLLAEKLRILRLLRGLDRAGMDPEVETALQVPLIRLAEIDALLTNVLDVVDREGCGDETLQGTLDSMLVTAEAVRGDVRDALDGPDQDALRRALDEVVANEAEIWMEVETLRETPADGKGRPQGPVTDEDAARIAAETWGGEEGLVLVDGQEEVEVEESRDLPPPAAPLRRWFEHMPDAWRETAARLHGVPPRGKKPLAERLARRVHDRKWLMRFLAERLGKGEREALAYVLATGSLAIDEAPPRLQSAFDVSWDWRGALPSSVGGKLRAAGLVHVGIVDGERLAVVPPRLQTKLAELLQEVDPESAVLPDRAARLALATALDDVEFEDEELALWKAIDREVVGCIDNWAIDPDVGPGVREAVDALFEGHARVARSEVEGVALLEFALLDWRESPEAPSLAEKRIHETDFATAEEQALAEALLAARPALYRLGEPGPEFSVPFTPIFPLGADVDVTDRGMSLTAEPGWLVGARVYRAGPYHFARLTGDPIRPDRAERTLAALRRALGRFVAAGGPDDPAALLRVRPELLIRTLRAQIA